jgi:hypothetical protein
MPDRPEDVDEAFARLIAGYDEPLEVDGETKPWPAAEDVSDEPGGDEDAGVDVDVATPPAGEVVPLPGRASGADMLDTEATWEDEGHFVPPTPPPLPRPTPLRLTAWIAVLLGPVIMTVVAALGWWVPEIVTTVLVIGFVAGVVYLIATMGAGPRDPYGPDNGAVV